MEVRRKMLFHRETKYRTVLLQGTALFINRGVAMSVLSNKLKKIEKVQQIMTDLYTNNSHVLLIHYSCESFYDIKDGRTPRVTSIAVRYLATAQTVSFSIHKIAERKHVPVTDIQLHYDNLEKEMLNEFFKFVESHKNYKWVHWNMRDINYGFQAIEHRYSVLGGKPVCVNDTDKFDLARLLIGKYGIAYIGHPRLEKLMEKNHVTSKDFLVGQQEAIAFENKEYVKLHQSTLRKVDIFNNILDRAVDGTLKTNATLRDKYGISPQGTFEMIKNNWFFAFVASLLGIGIKLAIDKIIK